MLRCRSIASLQRTVSTLPLVDFSRASHLDLFEQPARGFFSTLLDLENEQTKISLMTTSSVSISEARNPKFETNPTDQDLKSKQIF
jgi:hypothetical protein